MPSTKEPPVRLTSDDLQKRVRRATELLKRQGLSSRVRLKISNLKQLDLERIALRKKFPELNKPLADEKPEKEPASAA